MASNRSDFDAQMSILCAAFDVPCTQERKDAYWLALKDMPVAKFARTIEFLLREEDWTRIPKPGQIWAISRRLRASGPPKLSTPDEFPGGPWEIMANVFLLAHIRQQLAIDPQHYGRRISAKGLCMSEKDRIELGLDKNMMDASGEFVDNVNKLVAAKKAWAQDMRDAEVNGEVDPEIQKAVWKEYIERAESHIGRKKAA